MGALNRRGRIQHREAIRINPFWLALQPMAAIEDGPLLRRQAGADPLSTCAKILRQAQVVFGDKELLETSPAGLLQDSQVAEKSPTRANAGEPARTRWTYGREDRNLRRCVIEAHPVKFSAHFSPPIRAIGQVDEVEMVNAREKRHQINPKELTLKFVARTLFTHLDCAVKSRLRPRDRRAT
jgi:hypothetical protein